VRRSSDVLPEPGSDRDYARTYFLTRDGEETQTTVEFARGRRRGSPHRAVVALRAFLGSEDKPPRRLLVNRDDSVSILEA
jgi:hypothetical protein